ncbi:MAG: NAD-binding protein [Thiomargarita sp.]|nr:NAD-binding protein [Thiomargarita sp.]
MYLENHLIICNWHRHGERIVAELHAKQAEPNLNILIITEKPVNEENLRHKPEYENVSFIYGDPTNPTVLEKAGITRTRSIIILSNPEDSDPDAHTLMITLAITKCDSKLSKKLRIIAEVMNPEKIQHLKDAGVNESVCSAGFGLGIIAQTALYGKLSDVYHQLLTYSGDTNEIYLLDSTKYPSWFIGKTFTELSNILNEERDEGEPVILIGVKREEVILNPKQCQFERLQVEDNLILVAFEAPNLNMIRPLNAS